MAKARKQLPLPEDYLAIQCRVLSYAAGRNCTTQDFSDIPKSAAKAMLNKMADDGIYLKRLSGGRFQRSNASGLKALNEIRAEVKSFNSSQPETKSEIQARSKTVAQPQPYQSSTSKSENNQMSDKERQQKLEAIKAKILGERKEKSRKIETAVELERMQANLDGKSFNYQASWKANHDKLFPPAKPAVKADISHASEGSDIGKRSSRELVIEDFLEPLSGLSGNAQKIEFKDGRSVNLAHVSDVSSVGLQAESAVLSGSDLSFGGLSVQSHKIGNKFGVSNELLEDGGLGVVEASVRSASQAISRYLDSQFVSGSDIVSGDNIKDHTLIAGATVTSVAAMTLLDINTMLAGHDNTASDLVLCLHPSLFSSVIQDLSVSGGYSPIHRDGGQLYYGQHRIVFSGGLAGPNASTSGDVLAVAGSLKDGLVICEREPLSIKKSDQVLAANDQCLYFLGMRVGLAVRRPEALSRLTIA